MEACKSWINYFKKSWSDTFFIIFNSGCLSHPLKAFLGWFVSVLSSFWSLIFLEATTNLNQNLNSFFSPVRVFSNESKAESSPQYLQTLIKVEQQQEQMQVWNIKAEIMKFKIQYSSIKLMPIWNLKISIISRIKFQIRFNSNISWTDHWKNAVWISSQTVGPRYTIRGIRYTVLQ